MWPLNAQLKRLQGNKISYMARDCFWDSGGKMWLFSDGPKNLTDAKLKGNGVIYLV